MEDLIKNIRKYDSNTNVKLVKKAYNFAKLTHTGQKRLSGEPYFTHPLAVAMILADWRMDTTSIVVGLLHDTVEEGAATLGDINKEFGETIERLVDSVTVVGEVKLRGSDEEEFVEALRKMFLVMAKDLRVVAVRLADRLHNMQTLKFLPENKQKRIAKETMDIYAPLAERLGMGEIKGQLEDLSFMYLDPKDYKWLVTYSRPAFKEAESHVLEAKRKLLAELAKEGIKATIHGREKHLYSLYRKLLRPEIDRDIKKVNDIVALRILVDTVEQCYTALGVVHKTYKPVPNIGISDFIALPKPNGYRSIHTKVFGPDGRVIEIQIRTHQMHEQAEYGIASHIYYAEMKSRGVSGQKLEEGKVFAPVERLPWVKQLANWQKEGASSQDYINTLKIDILSKRIFVLTPNGDVKDLPLGATPVDFAYAVHTQLGDRTVGAKVNGKMVGLDTKLKSGDVCEVILSKEPRKPNLDWLSFTVTNLAKREIQKGSRAPI